MPHTNILFPFVTAHQLADAARALSAHLAAVSPFEISFDDVGELSHSAKSHTFWLSPRTASGGDIAEIHRAAVNLFPICDDSSSRKTGFCPHLALGQVKGHTPDRAMLKALWPRGKFTCSRVFIVARSTFDDPFHVRHVVPLGGGSCASGDWLYTAGCDTYWHDVATGETSMRVP
jgi:2'-5' RNA ligase